MSCSSRILILPQEAVFCKISGDDNLYGLGIRLGTYLVWVGSIIAYHVSPAEAESMRTLSGCYQLAIMIALIHSSASQHYNLFAMEAYILLALCIGGFCTSTYLSRIPVSRSPPRRKSYVPLDISGLGGLMRLILLCISAGYGLWYAFSGVDKLCRSTCANEVFFFAKVNLYDWYRTLLKIIFSVYVICLSILLGWSIFAIFAGRRAKEKARKAVIEEGEQSEGSPGVLSLLIGMVVMALFIIAIELTIYWNGIIDVDSCGSVAQLIPLVVGVGALCKILYTVGSENAVGKLRLRVR